MAPNRRGFGKRLLRSDLPVEDLRLHMGEQIPVAIRREAERAGLRLCCGMRLGASAEACLERAGRLGQSCLLIEHPSDQSREVSPSNSESWILWERPFNCWYAPIVFPGIHGGLNLAGSIIKKLCFRFET